MNKKGFTLIELLAVIIILGILMIIAIPSVTKYISDSRKNAYIDTAKEIVGGARNLVNEGKLEMYDTNTTYYIESSCIKTENASKSPYGEFTKAYVVVTYDGKGYEYYWTSVDEAGQGIKNIIRVDKLDTDNIESDLNNSDINNTIGIGKRSKYMLIDKDHTNCGAGTTNKTTKRINGDTGEELLSVVYPVGKDRETVSIGNIVKIGNEEFYIISKDIVNDRLTLIARYKLNVGSEMDPDCPYLLQQGIEDVYKSYGRVKYIDAYSYVNEYKEYLEDLGATIYEARLLGYEEGNSVSVNIRHVTTYWLHNSDYSSNVFCKYVYSGDGVYSYAPQTYCDRLSGGAGVRPVIVI